MVSFSNEKQMAFVVLPRSRILRNADKYSASFQYEPFESFPFQDIHLHNGISGPTLVGVV
jgi:hypothetical protein